MDEELKSFLDAVEVCVRPLTQPVGARLAREGEAPPPKMRYPSVHLKKRLAVCQGMTLSRTLGWTLGFKRGDHGCPLPKVFMGHITPDRLLTGSAADFYQDEPGCMAAMEASYPRWKEGEYSEVWLSPLANCPFAPDVAVVYGNPAQILALIQAANYGVGTGVRSLSSGRYGCSTWLAGVVKSGECTYMVPGPGERLFASTQDHEMSFAAPKAHFGRVAEGLRYVRSKGAYRYPVPNMGAMAEPKMPEKYYSIDPDSD